MKRFYKVAEFVFSLEMPESDVWEKMKNMASFLTDPADTIFSLKEETIPDLKTEPLYFSDKDPDMTMIKVYMAGEDYFVEIAPLPSRPIVADIWISKDFTDGKISFRDGIPDSLKEFAINNALMLIYAFRTSTLGALEFHSSVTMNAGKGYMFLGKSGTGKSTHSSLWLKHIPGSVLLNDDNPVVRVHDDGTIRVYGTPWSGKTPCYKQESVPVGAIVRIRQSPENHIERLALSPAYASVMASTSGLRAIRSVADGMHQTLARLVSTVPCYTLDCRPDKEAAELCYKTVNG